MPLGLGKLFLGTHLRHVCAPFFDKTAIGLKPRRQVPTLLMSRVLMLSYTARLVIRNLSFCFWNSRLPTFLPTHLAVCHISMALPLCQFVLPRQVWH